MNLNNYLPVEMIREIFSYLPIRDNLRCRSVCKLWRSVSSNFSYTKLSIIRQNPLSVYTSRFSASYEPIKSIHLIAPTNDRCLTSIWKEAIFRNVREMSTLFTNIDRRYLNGFYNHFAKLETLTIDSEDSQERLQDSPTMIVLKLKYLKKLVVNSDCFHFTLHTPELVHLKCELFSYPFKFAYADKIRFLSASIIFERPQEDSLSKLEFLVIRSCLSPEEVHSFFSGLSSLKEVHLGSHNKELFATLQNLEQFRKESNRHFDIFVLSLPPAVYGRSWSSLVPKSKQKDILFFNLPPDPMEWLEENTAFMLRNLPVMPQRVLCAFAINYNDLEPLSAVEREAFLARIEEIRSVSVSKPPENEDLFLKFLQKWQPDHLGLKCFEHHSDAFLRRLSLDFKFLRAISIEIGPSFRDFKRFSFLLKLENLTCLKVNFFSITFALTALKKIPHLKDFRLESNLIALRIATDSRMNLLKFLKSNRLIASSKAYSFPDKSECIQFLGNLEMIKPKELYERLPEPYKLLTGYALFRDY